LVCDGEGDVDHESGCEIRRWPGWSTVRLRHDNPPRAKVALPAWRDRNPAGAGPDLIAAIGDQFHWGYRIVLRTLLFAVDRYRVREITGVSPEAFQ
jgi:hypothetical protein